MPAQPISLDHNATTPPSPAVIEAVRSALADHWHNPSSVHRGGQDARHRVELARAALARLLGVPPRELVLCASGTESIGMAIRGTLASTADTVPGERTLITTDLEHAAVRDLAALLEKHEGLRVRTLPILPGGLVDAAALPAMLDAANPARTLVSVQWANNETGVVQPVEAIGAACRARGVPFHCDGTQWVGKMPVAGVTPALHEFCDLLTFSPHKFHGPKGVGGLWIRRGVRVRPVTPGSQELGRRGGTEHVAGIVGAGVAAEAAFAWLAEDAERDRLAALRDRFEDAVLSACPGAVAHGRGHPRLWNTTNIGFPRLEAEALLLLLSEAGVYASAGAACSSGSLDPSPVLLAMGVAPEIAHGSVRFSMSRHTTPDELDRAAGIVAACVQRLVTRSGV
jgi:cysteine desulfurase